MEKNGWKFRHIYVVDVADKHPLYTVENRNLGILTGASDSMIAAWKNTFFWYFVGIPPGW